MIDRTPLAELRTGQSVVTTAMIREVLTKKTRTQKDYLSFKFVDCTAELPGQAWDITSPGELAPGKIVKIQATVDEYNGTTQLNVKNIRVYGSSDLDDPIEMSDYIPTSKVPPEELFRQVYSVCCGNANVTMASFLCYTLERKYDSLIEAAAAKGIHHAYRGGLLEHVLSLMNAGLGLAKHYDLDADRILFACLFHDIGKTREMHSSNGLTEYTVEGTLIGHVFIGLEMFNELYESFKKERGMAFPDTEVSVLRHMIASHHGQLAWGAAKVPAVKEAIVFHFMDMIDSRLAIFDGAVKKDTGPGPMTGYVSLLESALLK
jgi:3'-5' exoribonuclease